MELAELADVGGHPALAFLNSTAMEPPHTVELIRDGRSYIAWLQLAGLVDAADSIGLLGAFSTNDLDEVAGEAIELREWLRGVVSEWAALAPPSPTTDVRDHLNRYLAIGSHFMWMQPRGMPTITRRQHMLEARQLLVPPAEAAALLLTSVDPHLVRHCEGPTCTLWFYDQTKSHRRRWCSMSECGNREKARRYRDRERMQVG